MLQISVWGLIFGFTFLLHAEHAPIASGFRHAYKLIQDHRQQNTSHEKFDLLASLASLKNREDLSKDQKKALRIAEQLKNSDSWQYDPLKCASAQGKNNKRIIPPIQEEKYSPPDEPIRIISKFDKKKSVLYVAHVAEHIKGSVPQIDVLEGKNAKVTENDKHIIYEAKEVGTLPRRIVFRQNKKSGLKELFISGRGFYRSNRVDYYDNKGNQFSFQVWPKEGPNSKEARMRVIRACGDFVWTDPPILVKNTHHDYRDVLSRYPGHPIPPPKLIAPGLVSPNGVERQLTPAENALNKRILSLYPAYQKAVKSYAELLKRYPTPKEFRTSNIYRRRIELAEFAIPELRGKLSR